MPQLTYNWANYSTYAVSKNNVIVTFYLQARILTQYSYSNTSIVQTRLRSVCNGNLSGAGYKYTLSYADTLSGDGTWTFTTQDIIQGQATITHENDGTKSLSLSANVYNEELSIGSESSQTKQMFATVTLPTIDRKATIQSAEDFDEDSSPTISFLSKGDYYVEPYLKFYNSSGTLKHTITFDKIQTSSLETYTETLTLTQEQRTALWNATNEQQSYLVREGIQTYTDSSTLLQNSDNYIEKTLTYVNAIPSINLTLKEKNQKIIDLYDTDNIRYLIAYASRINATSTVTAYKGATITKVQYKGAINGELTTSPYILEQTIGELTSSNRRIVVDITDSRGIKGSLRSQTMNYIDYEPVRQNSLSIKRLYPTSEDIRILIDSNFKEVEFPNAYISGTQQTVTNTPTVSYKIGESGTWTPITLTSENSTIDTENNKLTVDYTITDALAYTSSETIYVKVEDLLTEWSNSIKVQIGIPVMEWGENDVQVNGDLLIADSSRNDILSIPTSLCMFNDTSGNDWQTMMENKLEYCIDNMNTTKTYAQMFINGGWNGQRYGFGIFSKINQVYQLVWFSQASTYYCVKLANGTYNYRMIDPATQVQNTLVENTNGQTLYLPMVASTGTGVKDIYNTSGLGIWHKQGTTSATGRSELILGNNINAGTAGNKDGTIRLWSGGTGSNYIAVNGNHSSTYWNRLPQKDGTLALEPVDLWTNNNVSAQFGAQTIQISNLSSYAYIDIIFYFYYPGSTEHMGVERHYYDETRKSGQISQPFRYGSTMYVGNRNYTVNSGSIEFKDAKNNGNSTDNNWFKPYKIKGYK